MSTTKHRPLVPESSHPRSPSNALETVDDAFNLTDEEEAGIQAAIESVRAGKGIGLDAAKARIDRILAPPRSPTRSPTRA